MPGFFMLFTFVSHLKKKIVNGFYNVFRVISAPNACRRVSIC